MGIEGPFPYIPFMNLLLSGWCPVESCSCTANKADKGSLCQRHYNPGQILLS